MSANFLRLSAVTGQSTPAKTESRANGSRDAVESSGGYHFHDWCGEQLKRYHVPRPASSDHYLDELVAKVIEATDRGGDSEGAIWGPFDR